MISVEQRLDPKPQLLRLISEDVSVLQNFVAVNGGHGQSCRGKHAFDKEEPKHIHIPQFDNDYGNGYGHYFQQLESW